MKTSTIKKTLINQFSERRRFKAMVHGTKAKVSFQLFSKVEALERACKTVHGTVKSLDSELQAGNAMGMHVAIAVNQFSDTKREKSEATGCPVLFIDDDSGQHDAAYWLEFLPHAVVETSPKKFHVYWRVQDCAPKHFSVLQRALALRFDTDESVADLARVMRLPGTYNWKTSPPYLCHIVQLDAKRKPYLLSELKEQLQLNLADALAVSKVAQKAKAPPSAMYVTTSLKEAELALKGIPSDDRFLWRKMGMSIHSIDSGPAGYDIWDVWSKTSNKYNSEDQQRTWAGFKSNGGVGKGTLFFLVKCYKTAGQIRFDEMLLAEMMADTFSGSLRFEKGSRTWYHFNGVVWVKDRDAPLQCIRKLIVGFTEGSESAPPQELSRFRTAAGMKAVIAAAELLTQLHIAANEFDSQAHLLAVQNGVVDLSAGTFRPAQPQDFLSLQANTTFDAGATAPIWTKFINSLSEDKDYRMYLRRAAGYTLMGHARAQKFFVIVGSGGNGKGVFTRTLKQVMGSYAVTIAPNVLTKAYSGNPNSPSPAIAHLAGARMLLCAETSAKSKFDEAFIKQISGGDELTARSTYGEMFTFKPACKLWLTTNHEPDIDSTDTAMWRRLKPMPFKCKVQADKVDEDLEEKLAAEGPGILNWLLKGAQSYEKNGLGTCEVVDASIERLKRNADTVAAWMASCCARQAYARTEASGAYANYLKFVSRMHGTSLSVKPFKQRLVSLKGIQQKRGNAGNFYVGFKLRD